MLSLHQKLKMRERRRSLILYKDMNKEQIIETVHEQLAALLADNTAHFLVDVRIKPTNNIKIFIVSKKTIKNPKDIGFNKLKRINNFTFIDKENELFYSKEKENE